MERARFLFFGVVALIGSDLMTRDIIDTAMHSVIVYWPVRGVWNVVESCRGCKNRRVLAQH